MNRLSSLTAVALAALLFGSVAHAQQAGTKTQTPEYGVPITQAQAMKVAEAAQAKAKALNLHTAITIVGPAGDLIYFTKMDGTQYGSIAISQQKARTAALFRRPSKAWEDAVAKGGTAVMTFPNVIASAGGVPLVLDGKIVGAIGVSGAPKGTIDAEAAQAGADALK
jgi:uncharacterized protein GlcG (DUF336 family)